MFCFYFVKFVLKTNTDVQNSMSLITGMLSRRTCEYKRIWMVSWSL